MLMKKDAPFEWMNNVRQQLIVFNVLLITPPVFGQPYQRRTPDGI